VIVNGDAYSWGLNNVGQLGLGDGEDKFTPQLQQYFSKAIDISCGIYHTLALTGNLDLHLTHVE
jgi:alpha-tubulin suppressor-like RCC1 family protein